MDLHDPNGVRIRNREWVCPAFHDHDARHETRIEIVLAAAGNDGGCGTGPVSAMNLVFSKESVNSVNSEVVTRRNACLKNWVLRCLVICQIREKDSAGSWKCESENAEKSRTNQ